MYCKKCGKFIGTDADLCDECVAREAEKNEAVENQNTEQNKEYYQPEIVTESPEEVSLGGAVGSIILAGIGFTCTYLGLILAIYPVASIILVFLGLVPSVLGIILGAQAISYFRATSHIKSGKRIPVLILGISSLVLSGISLFFALLVVILAIISSTYYYY